MTQQQITNDLKNPSAATIKLRSSYCYKEYRCKSALNTTNTLHASVTFQHNSNKRSSLDMSSKVKM